MIYITDSATIPAGYFGSYTYTRATVDDLIQSLNRPTSEVEMAIEHAKTWDLISILTTIPVDQLYKFPISDMEAAYRPNSSDKALILRYGRWVHMGRFGSPDSMTRQILEWSSSSSYKDLEKMSDGFELAWLQLDLDR